MFCCAKFTVSTLCLGILLAGSSSQQVNAAPAETAPEALVSTITEIESAANAQNIELLMSLYGSSFEGPDGFTRAQYQETLSQFWAQYSMLAYEVDLLSWETDGDAFLAETVTTVEGRQQSAGRDWILSAEVRSRQRFENGQVVSQVILSEHTQLQSGAMPPTVAIRLPESVPLGQSFTFDAIVKEPLGNRLLLGRALNEGVTAEDFLTPRPLNLEQLTAGGLFKIGQAPDEADQLWISSVLVREDGVVVDTRRLSVSNKANN